jgi:hypothetical protein
MQDYKLHLFSNKAIKDTDSALEAAKEAIKVRYKRDSSYDIKDIDLSGVLPRYMEEVREEIKLRLSSISYAVFEIGGLLCLGERLLPLGMWTSWVESIPMKVRSAHNYKNVYTACFGRPEALEWLKPTVLYVICTRKYPSALRDFILENAEGMHAEGYEELLVVGELVRRGVIEIDDQRVLNLVRGKRRSDYIKRVQYQLQRVVLKIESTIQKIEVIGRIDHPEPMLPIGEKDTYPVTEVVRFLKGIKSQLNEKSESLV